MSLINIDIIDIKEQESFNDVFIFLANYIYSETLLNDSLKIVYKFSESNDLIDCQKIGVKLNDFIDYVKRYSKCNDFLYEQEKIRIKSFTYFTFNILKESRLYELISNYKNNPFNKEFKISVKSQKPKFKTGDKVKIIKDHIMDIKRETINFKGFEGVVYSSLNLISGMYNQNVLNCSYDVDINGFIVVCQESVLELIEQPKKIEYRKDLYDLSDDINGVLLPDSKPSIDFIQRFDK